MVRLAFAGLAMLALARAVAAEEDNGPALVDLFARTCALRPALPSELQRIAEALGFVSAGGAISAEMERGPEIDIIYSARLTRRGENVGLIAYFAGPADRPIVSCDVTVLGVSAEALPGLIEKSFDVHDRTEKTAPDDIRRLVTWRVGATAGGDTLEMSARRASPLRAAIHITYRLRKP